MIVESISDNLSIIHDDLVDKEELKKYIIDEKMKRIKNGFKFSLNDLVLVRSVNEKNFPTTGYYYPLNESNYYKGALNPFNYFFSLIKFGYDKNYLHHDFSNYKEEDTFIYHPAYRDTKHFTINALSSNINELFGSTIIFDDRPIIIIEPMSEHINNGLLVNLNPVDTFFNVHDEPMKVSDNAVFLINDEKYNELINDQEYKNILDHHKVFLFKKKTNIATDIFLLSIGILPQHSVGQRELIEEYYFNGEEYIYDKKYLKLFRAYIEYLNNYYLHSSYIHLPSDIVQSRKQYERMYPGLLHGNTLFYEQEVKKTKEYMMKTFKEYMQLLANFGSDEFKNNLDKMTELINYNIMENYPLVRLTFIDLHKEYEKVLIEFLKLIGYDKFMKITDTFNSKQLSKIDKKRID